MNRRHFSQVAMLGAATYSASTITADKSFGAPVEDGQSTGPQAAAVYEYEALAKSKLPLPTFEYISTGSADQITLKENVRGFQRIRVLPPLLRGVSKPDLSTTVLGDNISLPIMLAPVAGQLLFHSDGALASARAAHAAGTVFGVSSSVMNSIEEVANASAGPKWFQLYAPKDRQVGKRLVERAEAAGYRAIVLTVDLGEWKDSDRRNRFSIPRDILVKHLRDIGFKADFEGMSYSELSAFNADAWDMGMTWEVIDWLKASTRLPLILKGVLRPDDAARAVSKGVAGIVVSNHGGRRLDGMPATIEVLPEIVQAVQATAKVEIYLDGGIRRGTDVLKALALGARAVLIGRPYAWALAADGEAGVYNVIEILRAELINAMSACGCANIASVTPELLRLP